MPGTVDPNQFFREVTLRLCSTLDLDEALRACVEYIADFIPVYGASVGRFEENFESYRVLARASRERCELPDVLVPMPPEVRAAHDGYVEQFINNEMPTVLVFNDSWREPISRALGEFFGDERGSVMVMPLVIEQDAAGNLALLAEGIDRYSQAHADLFALLKEPFYVALTNALRHRRIRELVELVQDDNRYFRDQLHRVRGVDIIGADFGLKPVMQIVRRVAALDSSVLITGETGAGKEVIANAVHVLSSRSECPFITVNCGAIPDSLIDSELFGHEKGAFTGAISRKRGRFERANGGTIFLDEIGELPAEAQVRLLRVLQERTIERVGGNDEIKLDIRVIAATHRNLSELVDQGRFREDLYYRLKVVPIEIPPLRERPGDIPALVRHALAKKARELKIGEPPPLAAGAMDRLLAYRWPGNIRELENVVERELITSSSDELSFMILSSVEDTKLPDSQTRPDLLTITDDARSAETFVLDEVIAAHMRRVLAHTQGRIEGDGGAAQLMAVNPATLRNRMRKLGIIFGRASRNP